MVDISAAAAQVRAPGEWFTSEDQLFAYLDQTVTCNDDCWDMGSAYMDTDTTDSGPWCRYAVEDYDCDNTLIRASSKDRCGNYDERYFPVRYDDDGPTVEITVGEFTQGSKWWLVA